MRCWSAYLDKPSNGSHTLPLPPSQLAWEPAIPTKEAGWEEAINLLEQRVIKVCFEKEKNC